MLMRCPNCWGKAIPVEKGTKSNKIVQCNNCNDFYTLTDLKHLLKKKKKNML